MGSESSTDDQIRLARKTAWLEPAPGVYLGQGQRMLATDQGEYPLLDMRRIELNPTLSDSAETAAPDRG